MLDLKPIRIVSVLLLQTVAVSCVAFSPRAYINSTTATTGGYISYTTATGTDFSTSAAATITFPSSGSSVSAGTSLTAGGSTAPPYGNTTFVTSFLTSTEIFTVPEGDSSTLSTTVSTRTSNTGNSTSATTSTVPAESSTADPEGTLTLVTPVYSISPVSTTLVDATSSIPDISSTVTFISTGSTTAQANTVAASSSSAPNGNSTTVFTISFPTSAGATTTRTGSSTAVAGNGTEVFTTTLPTSAGTTTVAAGSSSASYSNTTSATITGYQASPYTASNDLETSPITATFFGAEQIVAKPETSGQTTRFPSGLSEIISTELNSVLYPSLISHWTNHVPHTTTTSRPGLTVTASFHTE